MTWCGSPTLNPSTGNLCLFVTMTSNLRPEGSPMMTTSGRLYMTMLLASCTAHCDQEEEDVMEPRNMLHSVPCRMLLELNRNSMFLALPPPDPTRYI